MDIEVDLFPEITRACGADIDGLEARVGIVTTVMRV